MFVVGWDKRRAKKNEGRKKDALEKRPSEKKGGFQKKKKGRVKGKKNNALQKKIAFQKKEERKGQKEGANKVPFFI